MRFNEFLPEARSNPDKNKKYNSGVEELQAHIQRLGKVNVYTSGVNMSRIPKLGINPTTTVTEDSPMGIYYYPLWYFNEIKGTNKELPWGDYYPYINFFTHSAHGSQVLRHPSSLNMGQVKESLSKYVSPEVIQETFDYRNSSDDFHLMYECLQKMYGWKNEIKLITLWNKVLRDMGYLVLEDDGEGWIAPSEMTQGCILDPSVITGTITVSNYKRKE